MTRGITTGLQRLLLGALIVSSLLGSAIGITRAQTPADAIGSSAKPNVIIFLIDDLGYTDPVCYRKLLNSSTAFYQTPNIDRLANQSVLFTDFYAAHPVCSPTRAALMTGKTPARVGITQWIMQPSDIHLPLSEVTIGEAFADNDYQTGYIGKWHLGEKASQLPSAQGFQWTRAVNRAGQPGSYFFPYKGTQVGGIGYWDVPDLDGGRAGDYLTDEITNQAIEFITTNVDRPFFLCFAHYAVHTPIQAPPQLIEYYSQKREQQFGTTETERTDHRNNTCSRARQDDPGYAAMIENLDDNIGRVLDKLDQLQLRSNTIIVLTSDNGGLSTLPQPGLAPTSVRPLRAGKGWNYEGGIRVPTLISWPGQFEPAVSKTLAITMDLYPTLLDLAGLKLKPEQHVDGVSLVSALKNQPIAKLSERFLAWNYPHNHGSGHTPSSAIRQGNWKLIHRTQPADEIELYDLANDLSESSNLAKSHPDKTSELSHLLDRWLESTGAKTSD
jgi:arylsulfatase A-like enzyme